MQFEQSKADALALSLQHDKSKKNFWQRLKMINKKSASYPTFVGGVSGASKVSEMWGNHFGSLLKSITNDSCNNVVQTSVNSIQYYNTTDFYCDVSIIGISINKLPCNSAAGFDGISAEHLFYCSSRIKPYLSILFNVSHSWASTCKLS